MYKIHQTIVICYCTKDLLTVNTHTNGIETKQFCCKAKVGKAHSHLAMSKHTIELHLFRWACQLQFIKNLESKPQKVVEAVAPSWPQLSKYMPSLIPKIGKTLSLLKSRTLQKTKDQKTKIVYWFQTYCNEEQLNKFKQFLQSQQPYWPLCHPITSGKYCTKYVYY